MLNVENVDLYYGASQAVRDVGFSAKAGEVTCILGRNGVGKTSILRAVMGIERIERGRVILDGDDLTRRPTYDRARAGIAYVPQGRDIFARLTVEENLQTGFATLRRADRAVPPELFEYFPVLRDMRGRRGGDLSGGQQQQLAIARALVTRPKVLLLDEPTEGIQPSIIKLIQRVIDVLRQQGDIAVVLVEQYFDFAHALADRIIVMDRGAVILAGTRDELEEADVRRHLTI